MKTAEQLDKLETFLIGTLAEVMKMKREAEEKGEIVKKRKSKTNTAPALAKRMQLIHKKK